MKNPKIRPKRHVGLQFNRGQVGLQFNRGHADDPRGERQLRLHPAAAAAGLGCLSLGLKAQSTVPNNPVEDAPTTHNMMLVGVKTAYISHLPMFVNDGPGPAFDSPHRFQVILEATFNEGGNDRTQLYAKDRLAHAAVKMYTLKPANFVLSQVDPKGMALKKFRGKGIFRGHLERGGRVIIGSNNVPSFDVNIKNVVHFRQFDPQATKPSKLEYLLFGKSEELFLAHFITKPPDFDQIISVRIPNQPFTEAQLSSGMHVIFADRDNTALKRIKEKDKVPGEFQVPGATAQTLPVEAVREFYFEESELAVPPTFRPSTEEEKKSGFPE